MQDFPCTRTLAVSKFSCIFDPMGIWQPLRSIQVLMARSFHGMTWDETASDSEKERWMEVWSEYPELSGKDLLVPRCVVPIDAVDGTKVEFLVFSDADIFEPPEPTPASFCVLDPTFSTALYLATS